MRWTDDQLKAYMVGRIPSFCNDTEVPDEGKESVLQRKIEAWSREWGRPCLSFHQSKAAKRMLPPGWPDVTIIMPNAKVLYLELKSASGRLSDEQKQLKLQFMALGHTIHEVRSYKKFLEVIGNAKTL